MKEETKKTSIALLVIIIIGMIGYFGYQHYKTEAPEEAGESDEKIESQKDMVIKELAEKYNALTNWDKNIHYTIQLQDLLVNSDKPVLFTGFVDDVFRKDNHYYIRFRTGGWEQWMIDPESEFSETQVYFVLKCDSDKVLEIINKKAKSDTDSNTLRLFPDNYIVVAKIENVTKPTSTFIATGTCIDFVHIEERQ